MLLSPIAPCVLASPLARPEALTHSLYRQSNDSHPLSVETVYNFPNGTWIENLAIRSNGQIIATEDTPKPRVYQIDPFGSHQPILLHEFSETASILGVVEATPDVFYVCSANYSSPKLQGYGEAYIFEIDLRNFDPQKPESAQIKTLAALPDAKALDGLAYLGDESKLLLVTDFLMGAIWSVNIETGEVSLPINNNYTQPSGGFGANGIKVRDSEVYFTDSQQQTLVKVTVDARGQAVSNFTILSHLSNEPDDFALDCDGNFYVTAFTASRSLPDRDGIVFVPREGGLDSSVASVPGATGCAFGRTHKDKDVLYVSTSGGDLDYSTGKPATVSGKIVKINLRSHVQ